MKLIQINLQHARLKESRPTIIQWKKIHSNITLQNIYGTSSTSSNYRGAWFRLIKTRQAKSSSQRIKQDVRHVNYTHGTLRTRKWKPPPRVVVRKIFPKTSRQERERASRSICRTTAAIFSTRTEEQTRWVMAHVSTVYKINALVAHRKGRPDDDGQRTEMRRR